MELTYRTKGTCSQLIEVETEGNIIRSVRFTGGCNGNLQGISRLVRERCDFVTSIPLHGKVQSMNVSTAAAVILAEAARQRDLKKE